MIYTSYLFLLLKRKIQYNKDWNTSWVSGDWNSLRLKRKIQYNKDWNFLGADYIEGVADDLRERSSIIRIETHFQLHVHGPDLAGGVT